MAQKTLLVRVTSAFVLQDRGVQEIGTELELPYAFAREMIHANKAEKIDPAAPPAEPAAAPADDKKPDKPESETPAPPTRRRGGG